MKTQRRRRRRAPVFYLLCDSSGIRDGIEIDGKLARALLRAAGRFARLPKDSMEIGNGLVLERGECR